MRSIRLSLIVYFLVLIAMALGGVSWFVYETSAHTLRDKQKSTKALIEAQYQDQCTEVSAALDRRLLSQARTLANKARSSNSHFEPLYPLGILAAQLQPQGYLNMPLWLAAGLQPRLAMHLYRMRPMDIVIEDADDLILDPDPSQYQAQEYFQTYNKRGKVQQRSETLGSRFFTLDEEVRSKAAFLAEKFDTVEPEPGWKVRRVTLKAAIFLPRARSNLLPPAWRFMTFGPKAFGPKPPFPGEVVPPPPPRPANFEPFVPVIFIQYASDTGLMEKKLGELHAERDMKFAQVESETHESLHALRLHLLGICLATFAGILAGGFVLIRLGLAPLARLSEAVSQVSEKDFRLKINPKQLPRELQPIAARLTDTLEQLKRAFAREKQAAADISHELRTPLAAMMMTLELALKKARMPTNIGRCSEISAPAVRRWHTWSNGSSPWSRLDAGADRLRNLDFDARDIARQCANLIRPLAERAAWLCAWTPPRRSPCKPIPISFVKSSITCCTMPSSTTAPTAPSTSRSRASTGICAWPSPTPASALPPSSAVIFSSGSFAPTPRAMPTRPTPDWAWPSSKAMSSCWGARSAWTAAPRAAPSPSKYPSRLKLCPSSARSRAPCPGRAVAPHPFASPL